MIDVLQALCCQFKRPELLRHPQIPRAMSGVNPRSILGQAWWDKQRKRAYQKNNYHCWSCGIHCSEARFRSHLEGHETYDIDYMKGTMKMKEVVALCYCCHNFIHIGRLTNLLWEGRIHETDYMFIVHNGYGVLHQAGLLPWWTTRSLLEPAFRATGLEPGYNCQVAWKDWRLILKRKRHGPRFRDERAWQEHYAGGGN
jgi:hypothetical protein